MQMKTAIFFMNDAYFPFKTIKEGRICNTLLRPSQPNKTNLIKVYSSQI